MQFLMCNNELINFHPISIFLAWSGLSLGLAFALEHMCICNNMEWTLFSRLNSLEFQFDYFPFMTQHSYCYERLPNRIAV